MSGRAPQLEGDELRPGQFLGTKFVTITADRVEDYLRAVGEPAAVPASVPFALLATEPWGWPGAYLPYWQGGVATAMSWNARRAVPVGSRVEVHALVSERYVVKQRENSTVTTEIRDAAGELCWIGSGTYSAKVDPQAVDPTVERRAPASPPDLSGCAWQDAGSIVFDRVASQLYWAHRADIGSGNFHTDIDVARGMGLPDVLIGSSHLLAWLSMRVTSVLGADHAARGGMEVQFKGMAFAGDRITAEVARINAAPRESARYALRIVRDDAVLLTGTAWLPD